MNRTRTIIISMGLILCLAACVRLPLPVIADSNQVLFRDDFSTNEVGWSLSQNDAGGTTLEDGFLRAYVTSPNTDEWTTPGLLFYDVRIDVDAVKVYGSDNNYFGAICRDQGNGNYYSFLVSSDGYYGISKVKNGEHTLLSGTQMSRNDDIKQGTAGNHLSIICQGDKLTLAVNGILIQTVTDADYSSGDVGLIVGSASDPEVDIRFDNFIVTEPEQK
jgi:hypothetical protein